MASRVTLQTASPGTRVPHVAAAQASSGKSQPAGATAAGQLCHGAPADQTVYKAIIEFRHFLKSFLVIILGIIRICVVLFH